jgi:thiol:disulfide interchange protein
MMLINNYSERALTLTGDTKKHKEHIKLLGGKWNHIQKCWFFSKRHLSKLEQFVALINNSNHIMNKNIDTTNQRIKQPPLLNSVPIVDNNPMSDVLIEKYIKLADIIKGIEKKIDVYINYKKSEENKLVKNHIVDECIDNKTESTEEESKDKESTYEESTDEESTDEESTDKESKDKESTYEESTDEESTDEESTDKESTDKESTDKNEVSWFIIFTNIILILMGGFALSNMYLL